MIVPGGAPVPTHHEDLPQKCVDDYDEARDIAARSPKAAAALMRLCIQKLMTELGCPGKNINDDIGALVKSGLPVEVQQALDYCRVIGNNAVHPGEINIQDDPSIAYSLFEMVNFVVEDRITKPKKIAELYAKLPEGALKAVEKRDGK
jgi:biotin operon repressor